MDFMKYNIDFEIFGTIIILIIIIFFKLKFDRQTESEKSFMRLAYIVLVAQVTDMASAVTISIGGPKLALFNLLFDTVFFALEVYMGLFFIDYILICAYKRPIRKYRIALTVFGALHTFFLILNLFYGFYYRFDFTTGDYIHEAWYYSLYVIPGILTVNALLLLVHHRKKFEAKQWISVFCFVLFSVIGLVLQGTLIPNIYLSFGLVTIAFLMIVFSLETPDYRKLLQTMDELEEAKKDAEGARKEAERANHVKSDFLASMSHEIRTPINSILGFDEVILRESRDKDITQYASNIKVSGQTLLTLINDILDFSKIESGKLEIIPVDYEVKKLLADLVLLVRQRAADKGLMVRCKIDEKLPRMLHGDDVRIRQIITNLLTNAVKYTNKGGVVLSMQLAEAGNPAKIRVSVKDTGTGIRKEDQKELFAAFRRVDEKKNRNIEGTGLGLAICVNLLEQMGSELLLDSEYGKGSEFSFVLAQEVVDETPEGPFDIATEESLRTVEVTKENFTAPMVKILVVDDVEMNLMVFRHLLKNTKMMIETADSGEKSLEMLRTGNYDMIFMDHLMPEMDGIETLKKGREDGLIDTERLPVIALTANAIAGARERFISEGFSDYLTKPIEVSQLNEILLKYLPKDKVIFS
ncbi:MAG: response regulator [Lachnospiraceae bacterium]|nr:response regulator [Lachnospiraceae bacterium]